MPGDQIRPRVFLSFAGIDRSSAKSLREALHALGSVPFIDEEIELGHNIISVIDDAIDGSDYFVLLWSQHAVGNEYVKAEYTAALMRTLDERRSFLFVVKMDEAKLPPTLAPRKYLEFNDDWDAVANKLVETWRRDLAVGLPVLPAPCRTSSREPTISLYVRNNDLSLAHVVRSAADATGRQLMTDVRNALDLKDSVTAFAGQAGARFHYRLEKTGKQIADDESIAVMGFTDNSEITLRVTVEWFGPKITMANNTYRDKKNPSRRTSVRDHLLGLAFGHLLPRQR